MTRKRLSTGIAGFTLLGALVGVPAGAEGDLARRLVALRALMKTEPAASAAAPRVGSVTRVTPSCADRAFWQGSDPALSSRIRTAIRDASLRFSVEPALIRSVIRHESAYDVYAVSHKGAQGLMQLMPATARMLGVECPFDPRQNILGGTRYLRRMLDRLGSWPRAVAAYNAGPTRVEAGRIPAETRRYVRQVMHTWRPHHPVDLGLDLARPQALQATPGPE